MKYYNSLCKVILNPKWRQKMADFLVDLVIIEKSVRMVKTQLNRIETYVHCCIRGHEKYIRAEQIFR